MERSPPSEAFRLKVAHMDDDTASARHTDHELLLIMDETADWVVTGRAGASLGKLRSLRNALRAVFGYEAVGHNVFAVCSHPGGHIIIFREQMLRIVAADWMTVGALPRSEGISVSPGH
jgi:hypothetical protein